MQAGIETDVDLSTEAGPFRRGPFVEDRPYDPSRAREWVRGSIALILIGALIVSVLIGFALIAFRGTPVDDLLKLFPALTSTIASLAGAAVGFYFGTERSRSGQRE